jgi:hypothetical protein
MKLRTVICEGCGSAETKTGLPPENIVLLRCLNCPEKKSDPNSPWTPAQSKSLKWWWEASAQYNESHPKPTGEELAKGLSGRIIERFVFDEPTAEMLEQVDAYYNGLFPSKKCECGSSAVGSSKHSSYCALFTEE